MHRTRFPWRWPRPAHGRRRRDELPTYDKAIVNTGYTLFQVHCASCHGADGRGGAAPAWA